MIGRWYALAERYVTAFEKYTAAFAEERRATTERTIRGMLLDERSVRASEQSADTLTSIHRLSEFMGGTLERLSAIETKLSCSPSPTSRVAGEEKSND